MAKQSEAFIQQAKTEYDKFAKEIEELEKKLKEKKDEILPFKKFLQGMGVIEKQTRKRKPASVASG